MTPTSAQPPRRLHAPLWLLALVTFSGTLAMHMFVPALPDAARNLATGAGAMQMAISIYIVGLAVGHPTDWLATAFAWPLSLCPPPDISSVGFL